VPDMWRGAEQARPLYLAVAPVPGGYPAIEWNSSRVCQSGGE